MSEPFIGQIIMVGFNFPPRGWATCDGQLLAISQNDALFSLLGTIYGGDGRTTFGLPDLRGRVPVHQGNGPGLSPYQIGQHSGAENVTLNTQQMPSHTHALQCQSEPGDKSTPANNFLAASSLNQFAEGANASLNTSSVVATGGGQTHDNMLPFQTINFCIALVGIYPSRS